MAKIEDLAKQLYGDNRELADAVIAHAREEDTVDQIERGELTLPHPLDAALWFQGRQAAQAQAEGDRPPPQPKR